MAFILNSLRQTLFVAAALAALALAPAAARAQDGPSEGRVVDITEKGDEIATTQTQAGAPVSSATLRMLRALEAFNKNVKTVHATFDQVRVDPVLLDTVSSRGELWFEKPARFRCDYAQPQPMITLVTDNTFYNYLPEHKQVEFFKFASDEERNQRLHHLLIAFGFDADALAGQYEIRSSEDDPELQKELAQARLSPDKKVIFQVRPRPAFADSSPFKVMKVTIDKASHLPEKIWYKDEADASLTLTMKKVELDPRIPAKVFDKDAIFPGRITYIDKRNTQ